MSALHIEKRAGGVAIVTMDVPGDSTNTLKSSFTREFADLFDALDRDRDVRAVVFRSGKKDSFIVGADVKMLEAVKTRDEAEELSRAGQRCRVPAHQAHPHGRRRRCP